MTCAERLRLRTQFGVGCFLLGFGGLVVSVSVYFGVRQEWFLAVVCVLYALGCLIVGAAKVSRERVYDESFEPYYHANHEVRWRAGIALHQAHRYRKRLSEFLALYNKQPGRNLTTQQLEWAEAGARRQALEEICSSLREIPDWIADSPVALVARLNEQIETMHALSWSYFVEHDRLTHSYAAMQGMLEELITGAHTLSSAGFRLKLLGDGLAPRKSSSQGAD